MASWSERHPHWPRWVHLLIYLNFLSGIIYAGVLVFTTPKTPIENMMTRRMYAYEAWLIIGFASLYFAFTDLRRHWEKQGPR
ncbi:MAG: hypothetical protein HY558_05235 [Euryarchaeota archaeon]|nr:hypothetical protein [Euryarchaeota archaeon]